MDFTLTDEQELLRETARSLLTNECPPSLVRAHIEDPSAADALWQKHLCGWVALAEGDLVDLCLFLEEMGAVLAPGVYFPTAALFLPLLQAIDHDVVPGVLGGEVTGTMALAGADGLWVLNGDAVATFVPEADRVDHIAFVDGDPDGPDAEICIVPRDALPVAPRWVETMDSTRRTFVIDIGDIPAAMPTITVPRDVVDRVIQRATVALAAEMMGATRWMLDASVAYAKERIQFDKPIGSFQGLQYKLVDMALDYQRALAAVYYAAMAIDADDPDRYRAVHVAKAAAGNAAKHVAKDAVQVHGGIGYTWEHDLHLYLRRAFASDDLLGPALWQEDRLADLLFD